MAASSRHHPLYVTADSIPLFSTFLTQTVAEKINETIRAWNGQRTLCLYLGASNGELQDYYDVFEAVVAQLGDTVSPAKLTCRHVKADGSVSRSELTQLFDRAAFCVLSGGNVQLGWNAMTDGGLDAELRRAADAGVVMLGVSAGAIHMGTHGYTGESDRDVPPFATLGLTPFVFGAHEEDEDWRSVRAALARLPTGTVALGIPKGGAAALHPDGSIEPHKRPLTLLMGSYPPTSGAAGARGVYPLLPAGEKHSAAKIAALGRSFKAPPPSPSPSSKRGGPSVKGQLVEVMRKLPIPDPHREQPEGTVRLVMISDTHSRHDMLKIPPGDVLLHCGDFCDGGSYEELDAFCKWLDAQPHPFKVVTAGNHDWCLDEDTAADVRFDNPSRAPPGITTRALVRLKRSAHYLEDSGCTYKGLRFWGSPFQPKFEGAFNLERGLPLRRHWNKVPDDVDVLLTHTPPAGHLDVAWRAGSVGCGELMACIQRVRPQVNVFGHIHECHGLEEQEWSDERGGETLYVNAASVDVSCWPRHPPIVVDLAARQGEEIKEEEEEQQEEQQEQEEEQAVAAAMEKVSLVDVSEPAAPAAPAARVAPPPPAPTAPAAITPFDEPPPSFPSLDDDVLSKIASLFEWDPSALCVLSSVSHSWRSAFYPLLKSFSRRLNVRIDDLQYDELLRRPILWRERRRSLVDGLEQSELEELHHQLSTMTSLHHHNNPSGGDDDDQTEAERWRVATEVLHTTHYLSRSSAPFSATHRDAPITHRELRLVERDLSLIAAEGLELARRNVNQAIFNQRRATAIAGATVGALAAWCAAVVAECDFFRREPEAREADAELALLRKLRDAWNSPLARATGEVPSLPPSRH